MKCLIPIGLLLCLGALAPSSAQQATPDAHPFVSPVFSDNMVLQRDQPDPVWGWTTPGQRVTVSAQGKTASATAGSDGYWKAVLPALKLGQPVELTVTGPQTVTFHNVLIGDVWVCSGQSNMEFGVGNIVNPEAEITAGDYPQIRLFRVARAINVAPQSTLAAGGGDWQVCTPDALRNDGVWGGFSAVAYFFGRDLYQHLHVPIGLIHTSWGGTPAEAWVSSDDLKKMPDFQPEVARIDAYRQSAQDGTQLYPRLLAAWYQKNDPSSAEGRSWAVPALDTTDWKTMTLPIVWQQAGAPDMAEFHGIAWFRKEVTLPDDAAGKAAVLHLGPVDDDDTTYINGVQIGRTENWMAPRDYMIPAGTLKAGRNVIAVRVLDTGGNGGLDGKAEDMHLDVEGQPALSLAGPWVYKTSVPFSQLPALPAQYTDNQNAPTVLYNGMIAPLLPFGIKGAIWYQGESNAGRAYQYRKLLPTMIGDWRKGWGEGDFPFLIVQLAGWQPGGDTWPELREAQWLTAQKTPNTGIATAIDIGDQGDIHPKNKQEVGRRLALVAEAQVYHENIEDYGPAYKSMKVEGGTVRLTFDHLGGDLVAKDGGALTGFTIAGDDRKFVDADAKLDGDAVVVSSTLVSHPVAVRYAWSSYPACSLYSKVGLPAFPFRTDDWPGLTVNSK